MSYGPDDGCPEAFYLAAGFVHTGEVDDGEIVLALALDRTSRDTADPAA